MIFVDLIKAFDTRSRDVLGNVLTKLGLVERMLNVIFFHEKMKAFMRSGSEQSDSFQNGTKQECVLALPLVFDFSIMHKGGGKEKAKTLFASFS